jgi:alkanesulfonate monooxygenase SsuD/methylene tetrahydromethanopterin reductase-like flavin-dependent oxidoreductase (luciferase family)
MWLYRDHASHERFACSGIPGDAAGRPAGARMAARRPSVWGEWGFGAEAINGPIDEVRLLSAAEGRAPSGLGVTLRVYSTTPSWT